MTRYDNNLVIPDGHRADPESIPGCPSQSSMGWKQPGFRIIAKAISGMTNGFFVAALFLAPAAWADNECGLNDPTVNGALADSYDCADPDYPEGVTYAADGDLTVNFTNAGSPARSIIGENPDSGGDNPQPGDDLTDRGGVDLSATGGDSITFDSATTATELQSNGVLGALLSVTTVDGSIDIDVDEMDADTFTSSGVTHAIFAESTGSGGIDINTTGTVDAFSGTNPADSIGIEAVTTSGNITLTTGSTVTGNLTGIQALSGGGDILIETSGRVGDFDSQRGIRAETGGAGNLTITASGPVRGETAAINATNGTGLLTINVIGTPSGFGQGVDGGIYVDTGGSAVVNIDPDRSVTSGEVAIHATGGALTVNNDGRIGGILDFSGLAEGEEYTFNNNGIWTVGDRDVVVTSPMGAGAINNAGTIEIGSDFPRLPPAVAISAPGTTFTGTGASLLDMNVFLHGKGQASCASATVAGCLDLSGGATAGQTDIRIELSSTELVSEPLDSETSANSGILLVDVSGGTTQADHFVLDPDSDNYREDPIYGSVLDVGGIFDYTLLYNPTAQQHVLASAPKPQAIEYVAYIRQAASIWHTTTDTVVGRQAALRDGATGKLWARYVGDSTDHDVSPSFTTQGNSFVYDQQYSLDTKALIIGLDLISGDDRVFGVHGGLVDTRAKFETDTSDNSEGITAGLYGGWWHESGLSLDGAINLNALTIDHTVSGDFESGDSDFRSLGARLEAGWRLPLMGEALYVQPLATAAYVTADFDDVELRDNETSFEGTESSRAGLGARVGGAMNLNHDMIGKLGYWVTARAWEEFADEGEARFATRDGGHLSITDDRSGSFEEVDFGVELTNKEGNINVHFAGGVKFGDQIDSSSHFSIGARLNW